MTQNTHCSSNFTAYISELPPSANRAYIWAHGRKILSPVARKYKTDCYEALKNSGPPPLFTGEDELELYLIFGFKVYNNSKAKTKFKKRDQSNWLKLLEDIVCKYVGVDDSAVTKTTLEKVHQIEEGAWIFLTKR